jgi:hypothetical protein
LKSFLILYLKFPIPTNEFVGDEFVGDEFVGEIFINKKR